MIPIDLAIALQAAGLVWKPVRGDWFVIPDHGMDEEIFVLSDLTTEVHQLPQGTIIGFNGTVEWALDDVSIDEALWLPREDQLRTLLGRSFRRLEHVDDRYEVVTGHGRYPGSTPTEAYGLALLALVHSANG